jgi:hypothetical protein
VTERYAGIAEALNATRRAAVARKLTRGTVVGTRRGALSLITGETRAAIAARLPQHGAIFAYLIGARAAATVRECKAWVTAGFTRRARSGGRPVDAPVDGPTEGLPLPQLSPPLPPLPSLGFPFEAHDAA